MIVLQITIIATIDSSADSFLDELIDFLDNKVYEIVTFEIEIVPGPRLKNMKLTDFCL